MTLECLCPDAIDFEYYHKLTINFQSTICQYWEKYVDLDTELVYMCMYYMQWMCMISKFGFLPPF